MQCSRCRRSLQIKQYFFYVCLPSPRHVTRNRKNVLAAHAALTTRMVGDGEKTETNFRDIFFLSPFAGLCRLC